MDFGEFSVDRNHPLGLSQQIADKLVEAVMQGRLVPGEKLPSENDLARLFAVSRMTVRKALSILEERGVIFKRRSVGTFVASASLLSEKRGHRRWIHALLGEMEYFGEEVKAMSRQVHRRGYALVATDAGGWQPEEMRDYVSQLSPDLAAGLLIYAGAVHFRREFYRKLANSGFPTVFVNKGEGLGVEAVVVDNALGTGLAVRHLYALGHRSIGYVGQRNIPVPAPDTVARLEGFTTTCSQLGVRPRDDHVWTLRPTGTGHEKEFPDAGYRKQLGRLLGRSGLPTALVCFNDWIAAAVWAAAEDVGLAVPEELSIVGFDNAATSSCWSHPLTTVDPQRHEIGATAVRKLVRLIEKGSRAQGGTTRVRPKLVIRSSTAAPISHACAKLCE